MKKKMKKGVKKLKGLSLQVIPFSEVQSLSISARVKKILNLVLGNKIVILHGRLRPEEEARLIEATMAMICHVKGFKGVELAVLAPKKQEGLSFNNMKSVIAKALVGDRESVTVIGPASIVRDIKKDPSKLEIMMSGK